MNKYELTIINNEINKSHRMSSMSYTTLIQTFFEHSDDIFNEITTLKLLSNKQKLIKLISF